MSGNEEADRPLVGAAGAENDAAATTATGGHDHSDVQHAAAVDAAVSVAGGTGPLRLVGLGIVLLVLGLVVRWGQDVAAPYVNVGEAEMADTVAFESDGGTYRIVTSGPLRPELRFTYCAARGSDGQVHSERGRDGVNGGHTRFGLTRVTKFDLPSGPAEVQCGRDEPSGGAGAGRFQVVDADGPVSTLVFVLLLAGPASLLAGIAWFLLRWRTQPR